MKLHVNLMLPSEEAQSGKDRKIGMAKIGITGLACILLAFGLTSLMRSRQTTATRQALLAQWVEIEPAYEKLNDIQRSANATEEILNELKRIQGVGIPWANLLKELKDITPEMVQYTKLDLEGRLVFNYNKTSNSITRSRNYQLRIKGKVVGETGSEAITEYVRQIPLGSNFSSVLDKNMVHLENVQRETVDEGQAERRSFSMKIKLKKLGD